MTSEANLDALLTALPKVGESKDPDDQIRAVLEPLIRRIQKHLGREVVPVLPDPTSCPNCGEPSDSMKSPYGSEFCRSQAAFIRQFRGWLQGGEILDLERQKGMGQALWNLQGGGFPRRQMMVPARVVAQVIAREGGVCQICGSPASEIDHTGSG